MGWTCGSEGGNKESILSSDGGTSRKWASWKIEVEDNVKMCLKEIQDVH